MTFKDQQEKIIGFISDNYKKYLPVAINEPEITTEALDFDKFKGDFTLFVDFSKIGFTQSNYKDDCGDMEQLSLIVYLVHRNNKSSVLNDNNLNSAYSFYEMLKENQSLGIAQNTTIDSIDFYKYIEGTKYNVCTEIDMLLSIEI
jgi:hypothetical protein